VTLSSAVLRKTRRKINNPCPSFSAAEKIIEPSGFWVAKSSPCSRVGLRQVTDQGRRLTLGLRRSLKFLGELVAAVCTIANSQIYVAEP
jgi:hypothetical protein